MSLCEGDIFETFLCQRFWLFLFLLYRHEAREIIKNSVNATDEDAVIFAGHGCADALKKLVQGLDLNESPIVFTGSNEHQDILEIWQEVGAKVWLFFCFVSYCELNRNVRCGLKIWRKPREVKQLSGSKIITNA